MKTRYLRLSLFLGLCFLANFAEAESGGSIYQATLMESNQKTPEISTAEMQRIVEENSALVLDPRPSKEYAIGHIPEAINIPPKKIESGAPDPVMAEIGRMVKENKAAPIVLYCNGPVCGKSRHMADHLVSEGYTNVRRYQLGIPIWRILVGVTEIELDGIRYVVQMDQTAVRIDARDPEAFKTGTLPGAVNLPFWVGQSAKNDKEIKKAKSDGRLPVEDHNTRIIIFGRDGAQSRALAEALAKAASFGNVTYYAGDFTTLREAVK